MARVGKSDFVVAWEKQPRAGKGPSLDQPAIASDCTGRLSPAPAALPLAGYTPCSTPRLQPFGQALLVSHVYLIDLLFISRASCCGRERSRATQPQF